MTSVTAAAQIRLGKDNKPVSQDALSSLQVIMAPVFIALRLAGKAWMVSACFSREVSARSGHTHRLVLNPSRPF